MKYYAYQDAIIELVDRGHFVIAHNITKDKYFSIPKEKIPASISWQLRESRLKNWLLVFYSAIYCLALLTIVGHMWHRPFASLKWQIIPTLILFFIPNLIAHEFAHSFALRCFGRRPNRFGFKMNYGILPALFVRMNQALLLPRREQFIIHSAGIMCNAIVCIGFYVCDWFGLISPSLATAVTFFGWFIMFNSIPILDTDGQKILMSISGQITAKKWSQKTWFTRIIMLISIIVVIAMAIRWIYVLMKVLLPG